MAEEGKGREKKKKQKKRGGNEKEEEEEKRMGIHFLVMWKNAVWFH